MSGTIWRMQERCSECPFATPYGVTIRGGLRGEETCSPVRPDYFAFLLRGLRASNTWPQVCHMAIQQGKLLACAGGLAVQECLTPAGRDTDELPPVHLPRVDISDAHFGEVLRILSMGAPDSGAPIEGLTDDY